MVRTRGAATFQQQFPLFNALVSGDAKRVAAVCTRQEALKCGPGNLSAAMLAVLLDTASPAFRLLASRAPLEARLSLSFSDCELHNWLDLAQVTESAALRRQLVAGLTALDLALALGRAEHAKALIAAGASPQPLLPDHHGDGQCGFPAAVTRELWLELSLYTLTHYSGRRLARAPAAVLPHLARLALLADRPGACLEVLQAAQSPGKELSCSDALAVVAQATDTGHMGIAIRLINSHGSSLLQPLSAHVSGLDRRVVHLLVAHLAGGMDSSQLCELLLKAAKERQHGACAAMLEAAAGQGLQLTSQHCHDVFRVFVWADFPARLAELLLAASEATSPSALTQMALKALLHDRAALLGPLLAAGAPLDVQLVLGAVDRLACSCLAFLLRRGPLPKDSTTPFRVFGSAALLYSCPVLRILQRSSKYWIPESEMLQELLILELLLTAGHRPPVYRNIVVPPDPQPRPVFDPLKDRPHDFPTKQGKGSWLWLALNHPEWSPANHQDHPSEIRRAFAAVLLAAVRGRRERLSGQEPGSDSQHSWRRRLTTTAVPGSEGCSTTCSVGLLASLPTDMLLHVLRLAARPLSAWVVVTPEQCEWW